MRDIKPENTKNNRLKYWLNCSIAGQIFILIQITGKYYDHNID